MTFYIFLTMAVTLIAKLFGFAREILLSYFFGASGVSDAYLISLTIPGTIFQFIGTGLATSYIPLFIRIKKSGKKSENEFTNTVATGVLLFSGFVSVLVWIFGEQVVKLFAVGFTGDTLKFAVLFTKINIFSLFAATFVYVFNSYLQANEKVLLVQIAIIPYSIAMLLSIVLGSTISIILLPVGSVIASIIQLCFLAFFVRKNGYKYNAKFDFRSKDCLSFYKLLIPVIIGVSINDINVLVDKTMASSIAIGSISALSYANSLSMFVQGVFVQTIASIYYPKITMLINGSNPTERNKCIDEALLTMLYFIVPVSAYCAFASKDIVSILFGRGAFDAYASNQTAWAFLGYSLGIFGIGCREIFSRIFYSNNNTKVPTINAAIGAIINIVFNVYFTMMLGMGVFGLAIATSISAVCTAILLYIFLHKNELYQIDEKTISQLLKIVLSTVVMILVIYISRTNILFSSLIGKVLLEIAIGFAVYLSLSKILHINIISFFGEKIRIKVKANGKE